MKDTFRDKSRSKRRTLGQQLDAAMAELKTAGNPTESYRAIKAVRKILTAAERRTSRYQAWVDEVCAWAESNRKAGVA